MVRRRSMLGGFLFSLFFLGWGCNGTETGNPGNSAPCLTVSKQTATEELDGLVSTICDKLILCGVSTTTDACTLALNGSDGDLMTDELGLSEGQYTFSQVRTNALQGNISISATDLSICETDISTLDCGEVVQAVPSSDLSPVEDIMPLSCMTVLSVPTTPDSTGQGNCQ